MIALNRAVTKLAGGWARALLASLPLAGCAAIAFHVPVSTAAHPIVTDGVFRLADGAALPYRLYAPKGRPVAVVLALHGYTDSRDGWLILSQVLNARGIAVYAPDQSSFGATANRGIWPGTAVLVSEAREMAVRLRGQYETTPLFVMGESMGGAVALLLGASADPPPVDGYVISAPAVWGGTALNPVLRAASRLSAMLVPAKRVTGQSVKVQASDNIPALMAFGADPLTIHAPRVDNVAGLVTLMGQAQAACRVFGQRALILYGGHDELIPAAAMKACWRAIPPAAPVTLAFYPPDYHLLERDLERATPDDDIAAFILGESLPSSAPSAATVFLAD